MPTYLAPDVYVEEVPGGSRPLEAVGTSTAGFIGQAPNNARLGEPVRVANWTEFTKFFIGESSRSTALSHAVRGFFDNGGSLCYVCNIGSQSVEVGLDALGTIDEIAIVAAPGYTSAGDYAAILTHCQNLKDRVAILDTPERVEDVEQLTREISEAAPGGKEEKGDSKQKPGLRPPTSDNGYGTAYYPWITVRDALGSGQLVNVPPSGHMAGIWARTDATRGVHKAPANESVRGAVNVTHRLSQNDHGTLNSKGINAIRFYSNGGVRVMGARTLAPASSEYRYVNVRRLFTMVEETIEENMRWTLFEPNNLPLWKAITRDISAFLTRIWRDGALMGQSPQEAFFVKCDAETNPQDQIDAGIVVTLVGMAPVKPAEFVVFRVSQYAADGSTDIESV